ncbi:MAG: hypothetical protein HGB03_01515 [Candidatus Yonathbacteria bacterium]|nr:hypothetical protein [Candidatus Yonathbacteria bacterium]NTW47942.1 hypothetical protein [Candidatus Yonathbacteria bacterium]
MHTITSRGYLSFLISAAIAVAPLAGIITPFVAHADTSSCTPNNTVLNIVAHQDDDLLFQNPDPLHNIAEGYCVQTVYLTAGDAGRDSSYWLTRENGPKAAYALMAGVTNEWVESIKDINGHSISVFTLLASPEISLVFLRLPDGGVEGEGMGNGTLEGLWNGTLPSLDTRDAVSSYTYTDLTSVLTTLMNDRQPGRINTHDFTIDFPGSVTNDHSDHIATAFFARAAHTTYTTPHTLYGYRGYMSASQPENLLPEELASKISTFFAYAPFDIDACQNIDACAGPYSDWLHRKYITASEDGGLTLDICSNIEGEQTIVPDGHELNDAGQCVLKANVCQSVVSDESDMTDAETHAVPAFVSPLWTATANIPGATWIWNALNPLNPGQEETVTFTKHITIPGTITGASITIATDDTYQAFINGHFIGNSNTLDNYTAGNEDFYDITSLVQSGDNELSIVVLNMSGNPDPTLNPAGLRYRLNISKDSCDITKPVIGTVLVVSEPTRATVSWTTDEPSTSKVAYGADTAYGSETTEDTTLVTDHIVVIEGLSPETTYHYQVISRDTAGNTATTDDATFTTPASQDDNGDNDGGNGGGGNGPISGSGGSSVPTLIITEKAKAAQTPLGNMLITWLTNRLAYGHVIYGIDTGTPYSINLTQPNFGYPLSVPSDPADPTHIDGPMTMTHSYLLEGLVPGKAYRYRIVSHASPAVVTEEDTFVIPTAEGDVATTTTDTSLTETTTGVAQTGTTSGSPAAQSSASIADGGATAGAGTSTPLSDDEGTISEGNIETDQANDTTGNRLVASSGLITAFAGVTPWQWFLIVLVVAAIIFFVLWKRKKDEAQQ